MSIKASVTQKGLELNIDEVKKTFGNDGYKKLLRKFIIRYKSPIGTFYLEKKNYTIDENNLILPRFCVEKLLSNDIIYDLNVDLPEGNNILIDFLGVPTYNQKILADHILNNFYNKKDIGCCGVTAFLLAGGGKTFLSMYLMGILKKKTLIVVPNTYLLDQWYELLLEFTSGVTIGKYYGKEKKDGDIVVAIVNSLTKEYFTIDKKIIHSMEYFKEFGFVVLDESHTYCTESFKVIYNRFQTTYMLGLSATPNERPYNLDSISHLNIGPVLIADEIPGFKKIDNKFDASVEIIKYNGPNEFTRSIVNKKTNMISTPHMIDNIIADTKRNILIVKSICKLIEKKLNIFIFSERRAHLEVLQELFNEYTENKYTELTSIEDYENNIILYGSSTKDNIEEARTNSRIIFTTYAYSSTGVSINRMTGLILATPRRSKSVQIIGRIFRLNKEYNSIRRYIIDIVDNKTIFKTQLYSRMSAYKERECDIEKNEISHINI